MWYKVEPATVLTWIGPGSDKPTDLAAQPKLPDTRERSISREGQAVLDTTILSSSFQDDVLLRWSTNPDRPVVSWTVAAVRTVLLLEKHWLASS